MFNRVAVASLVAVALAAGTVVVSAQSTTPSAQPATPPPATASTSAQSFVDAAAISDMYEVQAGKIAESKGQSRAIKAFGRRMVRAHTQTTANLKSAIKTANLSITSPSGLDTSHQKLIDQLNAVSGADFDQIYIKQQETAHQDALSLMHTYATSGDNDVLKKTANSTIPIIRQHIKMIDKLKS